MVTSPGRGTAHLVIAQGVMLVTGFVVSVILARELGPAGFAVYGVVMSVLGWAERVLNAGIPAATATLLARDSAAAGVIERTARLMLVLWSLPLFALLWLLAPAMARYFGIEYGATIIRIAALNIPAMALYIAYEGILNGRRRFAAVSAIQTIHSMAKLAGVLVLLLIGLSVPRAFMSHVIASLLVVLLAMLTFPLAVGAAQRTLMATILRLALPMTAYSVALVVLMNMSLWQLQSYLATHGGNAGLYVASLNLTKILMVVPTVTSGVLFVSLSWALANNRTELVAKYVHEAGRFAFVTLAPACMVLWIDAEQVMLLLYGAQYAGSGRVLAILCMAFAAVAILDIYFHALMAHDRILQSAFALAAVLPVMYVLNWLWIPRAQDVGAAWAAMVALSVGAVIACVWTYRHFGYLMRWIMVMRVLTATVLIGGIAAVWHVTGYLILLKFGVLALIYLAALFVGRELTRHDLHPFAIWKQDKKI